MVASSTASPPAAAGASFSQPPNYHSEPSTFVNGDTHRYEDGSVAATKSPATPADEGNRNQAPGILDRRRSTRPSNNSSKRLSSLGSVRSARGANGLALGPKIPIKVNGESSPLPSPSLASSSFRNSNRLSMAGLRSDMKLSEDDTTPGETSETFEDAAESVPSTPTTNSTPERSTNGDVNGLGINGGDVDDTPRQIPEQRGRVDGASPPKMAARMSKLVTDDVSVYQNDDEDSGQFHAISGHSRQVTAEKVQGQSLAVELEGADDSDISSATHSRSHSRQRTLDTAAELMGQPMEQPTLSLSDMRSRLQTHSRQATTETAPGLRELEIGRSDTRLKRLSRQSAVLEPSPSFGSDTLSPSHSRERSISPGRPPVRPQSPPKTVHGLSGDVTVSSPPPPSTADRFRALEERHIGDRQTSTSPPPQGGIARTASTRIAGFLGRMGSIRKPGKSPSAPRGEARFGLERNNTAQSIASAKSIGGESLASITDRPESDETETPRPSLQDQFQTLRKQEEFNVPGANGHVIGNDDEQTPTAGTANDAATSGVSSPTGDNFEVKSHRSLSIASGLRSPPLNPSLPPGTASGLSAGPAEEPRPVDWDLWQAVVNEGPAAVARTSGEELNRAIASGIPPAIRGVVWQVLAESKSPELENVYRTLKAKTSDDLDPQSTPRPAAPSRTISHNLENGTPEKPEKGSEVSSSRSSVHSENSTPATSAMASQSSPPPSVQVDDTDQSNDKSKHDAAALSKLEKAIKRDLGSRTSFHKYTQAAGLQDGLFGVCKAYALFDKPVGYAQGINFIAMPLLFNMTEEEAFTLLVRLMSKYDVRSMFTDEMPGLHLRLYQFERLLEDYDPALYCHLRRRHVAPQLYATQWFLTLFAYRFPLQLVLRVYDLVFTEGLTAILKFGLVLMQHNRDSLLGMNDMGHLTNFLKDKLFDVYIDKSPSQSSLLDSGFFGSVTGGADKELYRADEMVRDACEVKISDATLAAYTLEWEEQQRVSKENATELEYLRTSNNSLTIRIKTLEERTQQQDTEHVAIAGDNVRIKVENDELADENEGLKVKIEELQKMVDTQPAEVENKLKNEMDRILQRNSEVQSENRVLKEEMEEMEQELVGAKMKLAQTQADFETLMQKWSNVQAMMGER